MRLHSLVFAAAALAIGACASTETQTASTTPPGERDCFRAASANGFSLVDDRHVRVRVAANRGYILTTQSSTRNIDLTMAISLDGPSWICTGNGAGVYIVGGNPERQYPVSQIVREPDNVPPGS